jgi:hypothetical protein
LTVALVQGVVEAVARRLRIEYDALLHAHTLSDDEIFVVGMLADPPGHVRAGRQDPDDVETLEDPGGKLTLAEVASRSDFVPLGRNVANFGYSYSAYWLRFTLPRQALSLLILDWD